jgi:hypothetical protein
MHSGPLTVGYVSQGGRGVGTATAPRLANEGAAVASSTVITNPCEILRGPRRKKALLTTTVTGVG